MGSPVVPFAFVTHSLEPFLPNQLPNQRGSAKPFDDDAAATLACCYP
jgi:hypothetical protein